MFRRRREVVAITGASAGLGRAIVREYAKRGARLGLLARGLDGLEATEREVRSLGGEAIAVPTDIADAGAVEAAAEKVERTFGPIDIWINNAMVSVFSPVKEMRPEEYRRVTEVTYLGAVHGTLAALKRMLPRDRGVIVQVGTALAYRAIPLQSAYCAAKHAIRGFNESLRTELLHDKSNVTVTMVHVPALNTPQFDWVKTRLTKRAQPVPPIFQPEVAARAIIRAAKRPKREALVGYPTLRAVWGTKIAPGYADQVLARDGFDDQQTEEREGPDRPHNLWEPLPGDHGAHGRFDDRARSYSIQDWINSKRGILAAAGAAIIVGIIWAAIAQNGRGDRDRLLTRLADSSGFARDHRRPDGRDSSRARQHPRAAARTS